MQAKFQMAVKWVEMHHFDGILNVANFVQNAVYGRWFDCAYRSAIAQAHFSQGP